MSNLIEKIHQMICYKRRFYLKVKWLKYLIKNNLKVLAAQLTVQGLLMNQIHNKIIQRMVVFLE